MQSVQAIHDVVVFLFFCPLTSSKLYFFSKCVFHHQRQCREREGWFLQPFSYFSSSFPSLSLDDDENGKEKKKKNESEMNKEIKIWKIYLIYSILFALLENLLMSFVSKHKSAKKGEETMRFDLNKYMRFWNGYFCLGSVQIVRHADFGISRTPPHLWHIFCMKIFFVSAVTNRWSPYSVTDYSNVALAFFNAFFKHDGMKTHVIGRSERLIMSYLNISFYFNWNEISSDNESLTLFMLLLLLWNQIQWAFRRIRTKPIQNISCWITRT